MWIIAKIVPAQDGGGVVNKRQSVCLFQRVEVAERQPGCKPLCTLLCKMESLAERGQSCRCSICSVLCPWRFGRPELLSKQPIDYRYYRLSLGRRAVQVQRC